MTLVSRGINMKVESCYIMPVALEERTAGTEKNLFQFTGSTLLLRYDLCYRLRWSVWKIISTVL